MELGQYFSASNFNTYSIALNTFIDALINDERFADNKSELENIKSQVEGEISYDYSPPSIRTLFNRQEAIIQNLDIVTGKSWENPYSQTRYEFKKNNGMLYSYIQRWFDWIIFNLKQMQINSLREYLYSIEENGIEQVFDENGEAIMTEEMILE